MQNNTIIIHLRFKEYEFRRAKSINNGAVIYTSKEWIGKTATLIPVPYDVNDKMIEHCKDENNVYEVALPTHHIVNKTIADGGNIGRAYVPKEFIGYDFIIIETPPTTYI